VDIVGIESSESFFNVLGGGERAGGDVVVDENRADSFGLFRREGDGPGHQRRVERDDREELATHLKIGSDVRAAERLEKANEKKYAHRNSPFSIGLSIISYFL